MRYLTFCSFLCLLISCRKQEQILKIKGSDTEVNLSVLLAEAYYGQHPEANISVSGGGSGLGIASLLNGLADVANSSRPINPEESELFAKGGIEIIPYEFAQDALAIIVHPDVPIDSIAVADLQALFSGQYRNWQQLNLPEGSITLYGRQSNSGTYDYLKAKLGIRFSPYAKEMNGNAQIIEAVMADKGGLGYVGAGYVMRDGKQTDAGFRILKVYEPGKRARTPLEIEAVENGEYYFRRPLYQYILKTSYAKALPLLQFEQSAEGQRIIRANGYFPIKSAAHE